jgi:hypothetical protein
MINIQIKLDNLWLRAACLDSWIKSVYIPEIKWEVEKSRELRRNCGN